jgi:hypothetical protein
MSPGGRPDGSTAAIGFTVKSGWTSAVLLAGPVTSPYVVDSCRIDLSDPAKPDCRQPYHAGFGTARDDGPELSTRVAAVKRFGSRSVSHVLRRYQAGGYRVRRAGVVVGSLIDPRRIANDHIRIHALEGQLFRRVLTGAALRNGVTCSVWRDRDLHALAAEALHQPEHGLRTTATRLGKGVDGPWRAEQKAAALAAWIVLAGGADHTNGIV